MHSGPSSLASGVRIPDVPDVTLEAFKAAHSTLDDYDEPINNWVIGPADELFNYELVGTVQTQSGFVAALKEEDLARMGPGAPEASPSGAF